MPINEMIPLQAQVQNPLNALASGYQLGNTIRQQPMVDQANQQKLQTSQMQIEQQKLKMQELAKDSRTKAAVMGAAELQSAPVDQWANILQDRINGASRYGYGADAEKEALQILQTKGPEALKQQVDGLVKFGSVAGILSGGNSGLRQQEIDLRRQALEQNSEQFKQNIELQRARMGQEGKALDLQLQRLNASLDTALQADLAAGKSSGAAEGKKGAERKAQFEDWQAFQQSFGTVYPDINGILQAAPDSSLSNAVTTYGAKVIGGSNPYEAQAEIEQLGAILLQQVPYPPGAQSEAEQKARALTLGRLEDPNISAPKKLEMINRFLQVNEMKFRALRGDVPNGPVPPVPGSAATPENMAPTANQGWSIKKVQ